MTHDFTFWYLVAHTVAVAALLIVSVVYTIKLWRLRP